MRILISGLSLFLAATVGGCSDPASEQPVSLKRGLYQMTIDRTVLGPIKASSQSASEGPQCVASGGDLDWIYPLIERKFCPDCTCSTRDKTRKGNAIAARAVCPHDDDGTFGALEYAYEGVISEEGVKLEGKVKSGLATYVAPDASEAEKADAARVAEKWESVALAARIERVGDCPG
jgi:hypothetical protein